MCGIAGFVGRGDRADLTAMVEALVHRGPDGEGLFHDPAAGLFLGHRRLAIVDLSDGFQPMWNEHKSVGVVFNGEIYNHQELRGILTAKGQRFTTDHSDTEVLVHGYEEWGEDLPARLNGMFAFAIYDVARRRMFLARDRFGEKPLYYYERTGFFAFASELSALCRHRDVETRPISERFRSFSPRAFAGAERDSPECAQVAAAATSPMTWQRPILCSEVRRQWSQTSPCMRQVTSGREIGDCCPSGGAAFDE